VEKGSLSVLQQHHPVTVVARVAVAISRDAFALGTGENGVRRARSYPDRHAGDHALLQKMPTRTHTRGEHANFAGQNGERLRAMTVHVITANGVSFGVYDLYQMCAYGLVVQTVQSPPVIGGSDREKRILIGSVERCSHARRLLGD